jgi:hypothetical protein
MCLKYLDVKGIKDDVDYLRYVNKHGDTTTRDAQFKALADIGVTATFKTNLDSKDIKNQIDKGKPVAVGILHHGNVDYPTGGRAFCCNYWLLKFRFILVSARSFRATRPCSRRLAFTGSNIRKESTLFFC